MTQNTQTSLLLKPEIPKNELENKITSIRTINSNVSGIPAPDVTSDKDIQINSTPRNMIPQDPATDTKGEEKQGSNNNLLVRNTSFS